MPIAKYINSRMNMITIKDIIYLIILISFTIATKDFDMKFNKKEE